MEGEYRKVRNQTGPGKGDRDRTADRKAFEEGMDRIAKSKKRPSIAKSVVKKPGKTTYVY